MKLIKVVKSSRKGKKYDAFFDIDGKEKKVSFGAEGYSDYTQNKDPARRESYIKRHRPTENWSDPTTPGALSRYILWEDTDINKAISGFKKRYNI
jgi:hypothetical protein